MAPTLRVLLPIPITHKNKSSGDPKRQHLGRQPDLSTGRYRWMVIAIGDSSASEPASPKKV